MKREGEDNPPKNDLSVDHIQFTALTGECDQIQIDWICKEPCS